MKPDIMIMNETWLKHEYPNHDVPRRAWKEGMVINKLPLLIKHPIAFEFLQINNDSLLDK